MSVENKYYSINLKNKESRTQEVGFLNKATGLPEGTTQKVKIQVGSTSIPNFSTVWGKLEEKEGKLTGKIEFLEWGEEGGRPVEIRFLPSCASLSKLYQDTVLKLTVKNEETEITLKLGVNDFDLKKQPLFIEMIKHHSLNGDNKSRDPNNPDIWFWEHNSQKRLQEKTVAEETRRRAVNMVLDSKHISKKLVVLADLFNEDPRKQDDALVEALLEKATANPVGFLHIVDSAALDVKALLERAVDYNLIDLKPENEVHLITGNTQREQLFKNVKGKGNEKIKTLVEGMINADVYDGIIKLRKIVTEYERKQAN